MDSQYEVHFNQDFTSLSVITDQGFRLFSITGDNSVDEVYADDSSEKMRIVERFLNSSLVVLVSDQKPHDLKMVHFRKPADICKCTYPSEILCVRMSRHRLIVCLIESIHIQDIRNMKHLHTIDNIAPNELGLCTLSLNSQLAFPTCTTSGELRIFNAEKLKAGLHIKAHETALLALVFDSSGQMLATASERGTVIRLWCARTGQRLQEFRRGVKRCVRIASLLFSRNGQFLCTSSNTETVHIFKIDTKFITNNADLLGKKEIKADGTNKSVKEPELCPSVGVTTKSDTQRWSMSNYFTRAVSSVLPVQLGEVLTQDRSFATAVLSQRGLKHVCGVALVQKKNWRLLIASADGFLYIHEFDPEYGGPCKLLEVHDLRGALLDVIELNLSDLNFKLNDPDIPLDTAPEVIVENAINLPDNSYASVVKGVKYARPLTESAKFRRLQDAISTPSKLYDENQFPPVIDC